MKIKKGTVLARLESEIEQAAVAVAKARVASVSAIETAKLRQEFSQRKYDRALSLSEQKHISSFELDEAKTEMLLAQQSLKEVEEQHHVAKADLKRAEAQLASKTIRSPYEGVVVKKYMKPGERVENDPVLRIAKIDPLLVDVLLPARMIGEIVAGMTATVSSEISVEDKVEAKVILVDPVIDAASGLFSVQLEIPNKNESFYAGLTCDLSFENIRNE